MKRLLGLKEKEIQEGHTATVLFLLLFIHHEIYYQYIILKILRPRGLKKRIVIKILFPVLIHLPIIAEAAGLVVRLKGPRQHLMITEKTNQ